MASQSLDSGNILHIQTVGSARLISDRRQLAGILLLLGVCATIEPLVDISIFVGKEEFESTTLIRIASFIAALIQVIFGSLATAVGFLHLVQDYGNSTLSGVLIVVVQGAWAPFVIRLYKLVEETSRKYEVQTYKSLSGIGEIAKEEYVSNAFIPEEYAPNVRDVRIVGSMGIVGEMSYMLAFYGALAFCAFAIDAFDRYKPTARDGRFYRGRHLFYSFVLTVAGLSQLLLGAYVLFGFGAGPLHHAITVAMYTVYYPEMTIAMGSLQMIIGYFGIARYLDCVPAGAGSHQFQAAILLQWMSMVAVQYLTQMSLSLEDDYPRSLPAMVLLSVGLNVFPAFLDYKMRTTPFNIPTSFYDLHEDSKSFPSDMQGIANRGLTMHSMRDDDDDGDDDDEETGLIVPKPLLDLSQEDEDLINMLAHDTSDMDSLEARESQVQGNAEDPNQIDISTRSQPQSQGSESVDPPTDLIAGDSDESDRLYDSDSDQGTPSRRSSQMHPLSPTGFFGDDMPPIEDATYEDINPNAESDQDGTMDGLESEEIDDMFRAAAARKRSSDATERASNSIKNMETTPLEDSESEDEGEYNPNKIQNRERSLSRDPPGVTKTKRHSSFDENSDTADDDTEALDEKLLEIEREFYTPSMEKFRQSLVHIL